MAHRIECPACRAHLEVSDEHRSKQMRCPICGTIMMVPAAPAPQPVRYDGPASPTIPPASIQLVGPGQQASRQDYVQVRHQSWIPYAISFLILASGIGSVICFNEGLNAIAGMLIAGASILALLLPFMPSVCLEISPDELGVQLWRGWWVRIAWKDIAVAELFIVKGADYLGLILTPAGKQKFGCSFFAAFVNAWRLWRRCYDCCINVQALSLAPAQILDLVHQGMCARKNSILPVEADPIV